ICRRGPASNYVKASLYAGPHERDFLEEKVAEIRSFIPTEATIVPYQTPERDSGNRTTVLRYRVSSTLLRPVYNLLYPYRRRRITRAVLELLGGRAAAWLWAEGARPGEEATLLRRVGSTEAEARLISGWLTLLTGAESTVLLDRTKPRLHFEEDQACRVRQAIRAYAPTSRLHLFNEP
ncbi:MAG: hypothetical protein VKM98_08055, partial [Cyanobacteriota bacterium]|nr:hypothetical protein [Cyanobacteriota bacterium]